MTPSKRTSAIQVRVTLKEKQRLKRKARRAGLSLSEFLRQSAMNQPAATISAKVFRSLYAQAERLRKPIYAEDPVEGDLQLEELLRQILAAYTGTEVDDGSDEDLAD